MRKVLALGALTLLVGLGVAATMAPAAEITPLVKPSKMYAAIVNAVGTISRSVDVDGVVKTDPGLYTITFNKKIEQCYPVATIYGPSTGSIRVDDVPGEPKQLYVRTRSEGNAFTDRSFTIIVLCP